MAKKAHKRSNPVKGVTKRIKAKGSARNPGNAPSIPDLTDALAAAMAKLKAAQMTRLMGNATAAALPEESTAGQARVGRKKARKARDEARKMARKARKQAEKEDRKARKQARKQDRRSRKLAEREARRARKQAQREARQARKQAEKAAGQAGPTSSADPQDREPRRGLRAAA